MVIDDDLSIRKTLARTLERSGYAVSTAANGREGMKKFKDENIDLIITDIFMPDSDGFELLFKLIEARADIKIIVMSGGPRQLHCGNLFLETAKTLGANYTLEKPFSNQELLSMVESLLPDQENVTVGG
ncbi:MAG: response regulator [Magnetococcales bacterium]|nr:response regulator [Magnetococcales bacterium]